MNKRLGREAFEEVSPYLRRPLRSLDEAERDHAACRIAVPRKEPNTFPGRDTQCVSSPPHASGELTPRPEHD